MYTGSTYRRGLIGGFVLVTARLRFFFPVCTYATVARRNGTCMIQYRTPDKKQEFWLRLIFFV